MFSDLCPSQEYVVRENSCYLFKKEKVDFDTARARCKESGGDLASVLSSDEDSYILTEMTNLAATSYWIGLQKENSGKTLSLWEVQGLAVGGDKYQWVGLTQG